MLAIYLMVGLGAAITLLDDNHPWYANLFAGIIVALFWPAVLSGLIFARLKP